MHRLIEASLAPYDLVEGCSETAVYLDHIDAGLEHPVAGCEPGHVERSLLAGVQDDPEVCSRQYMS